MDTKTIPLHHKHLALGAKMVPFAGFEMPIRYSSDNLEHLTVRNKVGLFDVSHMGEFWVRGAKAFDLIQYATTNDIGKLAIGQVQYNCLVNDDGGVVDDLLVYRIDQEKYFLVVNASRIDQDWEQLNRLNKNFEAELENASNELCLFALQGPLSEKVLSEIADHPFSDMKYYHWTTATLGKVENILISTTGYTGERGFELYVPNIHAEYIWDLLITTGKPFGLLPIGLGARDTLRLEMGYCLYGHELNEKTSPISSGLGWIVSNQKSFLSSSKILEQKNKGVSRKIVGLVMLEKAIPRAGYKVFDSSENEIGEITSGTMSPSLGKGIALAMVKTDSLQKEGIYYVQIRDKKIPCEFVSLPFVKNTSLRNKN